MQKAAEDMKKKAEEEAEIKRKIITERVAPLEVDGLSKSKPRLSQNTLLHDYNQEIFFCRLSSKQM